jgi:hypothetical protein
MPQPALRAPPLPAMLQGAVRISLGIPRDELLLLAEFVDSKTHEVPGLQIFWRLLTEAHYREASRS